MSSTVRFLSVFVIAIVGISTCITFTQQKTNNSSSTLTSRQKVPPVTEEKKQSNASEAMAQPAEPTLSANQQKWLEILPMLERAKTAQHSAYIEHVNELRNFIWSSKSGVDPTDFADQLISLDSVLQSMGTQSEIESYLLKEFTSSVLDTEELLNHVQLVYDSLNNRCAEIDTELLVEAELDLPLDPSRIQSCTVSHRLIDDQLDRLKKKLSSQLFVAVEETILATTTGGVAGIVGGSLASSLGNDADGNSTILSGLFGLAGAATADWVAGEVTLDILDTRNRLKKEISTGANELLHAFIGNGQQLDGCEIGMKTTISNHHYLLQVEIAKYLELAPDWANEQFDAFHAKGENQ